MFIFLNQPIIASNSIRTITSKVRSGSVQVRFNIFIFLNRLVTIPNPIKTITGRVKSGPDRFQVCTVPFRSGYGLV